MGSSFFFLVSTQCLQAVFPSTLLLPRGFELLIMHSVEERAEGRRRGAVGVKNFKKSENKSVFPQVILGTRNNKEVFSILKKVAGSI